MDTLVILFVLPLLVIFSYLFDAIARKTKFPSVILLMFTGIVIRSITGFYGFSNFAFLDNLIPVLGTVGLILIVLEGALELEITKEKLPIIGKGFFAALIILMLNIVVIAWVFQTLLEMEYYTSVIYAVPLSIISSAVAIPSAANLLNKDKEFVVYESTFSDILGIMIFNYAIRQAASKQPLIGAEPIVALGLQIIGVIVISLVITYILFRLLQNIEHHVKFFLILALLILVYAIGKFFHLPALVTIFIFGLFLSNVQSLLPDFLKRYLDLNQTEKELHNFHILTAESTFIVRTFFFLFFGFSIVLTDFNSIMPFVYGLLVFIIMLGVRYLYLSTTTLSLKPSVLVYMSPRGLISILLFLQIGDLSILEGKSSLIDERVLLIIILCSMVAMLFGTMKKPKEKSVQENAAKTAEDSPEATTAQEVIQNEIDASTTDIPTSSPTKEE